MAQQGPPPGYGQPGAPPGYNQAPPDGAPKPDAGTHQYQYQPPAPIGGAGCPPGLEYLTQVDQILIKQVIELIEIFTGWETNNRFRVLNTLGQQVYFIQEETDCMQRQCCGPGRGFILHVTDNNQQEVMRIERPFKCCAGCPWCAGDGCCAWELSVEAPVGNVIGYVRQECSSWKPKFKLMDTDKQDLAIIEGPCCVCNSPCCGDVEFPVYDPGKNQEIGMLAKQWTGALSEYFTDADNFCVKFPLDMDVRMKALYFGAMMLIDFMYFEQKKNNN